MTPLERASQALVELSRENNARGDFFTSAQLGAKTALTAAIDREEIKHAVYVGYVEWLRRPDVPERHAYVADAVIELLLRGAE